MNFFTYPVAFGEFKLTPPFKVVLNKSSKLALETLKITVCSIFLEFLSIYLVGSHQTLSPQEIRLYVILAPLCEEIFFRGIMQKGISLCLEIFKKSYREDKTTQIYQVISIYFTAFAYAFAHLDLTKNNTPRYSAYAWFFTEGICHGYFYEKCGTLSAPFLNHAISNLISVYLTKAGSNYSQASLVKIFLLKLIISCLFFASQKERVPTQLRD